MKFRIENMKCMGCVANARRAVEAIEGIEKIDIDLEQGTAEIEGDADPARIAEAITEAGYPTTPLT